jgi:signal transduction histidine kinase
MNSNGTPRANQNFTRPASPQFDWLLERVQAFLGTSHCWFMPLLCGNEPVGGIIWIAREDKTNGVNSNNSMAGLADLLLVAQSWGMTLRTAQIREQQTLLTESLAAANRELGALQQQLVRVKSLSSLGEMAAGAAHEMNNPLAVVCGRAQLLASKLSDQGMKQDATLIFQQGQRLSQIITDMMEFAKPLAPKMSDYNVGESIEQAVNAAAERAGAYAAARVKLEVSPNIPQAKGDAKQIQNAVAEVVLNAIQATRAAEAASAGGGGGKKPADVLVQVRFDPMDLQLVVQVTDYGVGMSEDVIRQAFSPFYSAKSAGRNRGLGLAKALRWIENHGGTIRLDSTPNAGTTAVLLFPLTAGA